MLLNLIAGTAVITLTVVVHMLGLIAITAVTRWLISRLPRHGRRSRALAMISVVYGLFVVLTCEVWIWALSYRAIGAIPDFPTALYFSTITFSTVGYGDIIPGPHWRMFAAMEGINGFLLIGWSTAYLIAAGTRIGPFRAGEHF